MLFSSITFLYYFLPCVLLLYYIVPKKVKNVILLLASICFYAWGESVFLWKIPAYTMLLVVSALACYGFALLIEHFRGTAWSKVFLILSIIECVGVLVFFKYTNFFITNFNVLTKSSVPLLKLALPLGISFYTFQIISYNVDVYRNRVKANKNPIVVLTYVTLFPQLIAGPIVRYSDIEQQLATRTHSFDKAAEGVRRFVFGLAKKILIANALGELCEIVKVSNDKSVLFYWLYAIAFTLHIYFDFSGYSDMAIGLGKIFGFELLENFDYPYISKSITEFWRRWHMSLGSWFRDYVYIPLGGSRTTKVKWIRNILIVWALTGFWHGASWNFIVWGLLYAVLLLFEKIVLKDRTVNATKHSEATAMDNAFAHTGMKVLKACVAHGYVMLFVIIGFVIFNATNLQEAFVYIAGMFGLSVAQNQMEVKLLPLISQEALYYGRNYLVVLVIACICAGPWIRQAIEGMKKHEIMKKIMNVVEVIVIPILMIIMTAYLVDGSFNPFLYFRF